MSYNSEDYFLSNDFKAILKKFEEAENEGRFALLDSDELVDIAEYYYNNGKPDKAGEIIERTLSVYPGSAAPLLFQARLALIEDKDTAKAEYFTEMIEDKTDPEYFYMKAETMLYKGMADEADTYLKDRFDEIDDEDKDYFAIDSAALFIDYGAIKKAEKWLKRCEDTDLIDYKEQAARISLENGEYEKSKKLYNELIDEDPFSTQYWNSLASSQFFSNNIEDSIQSSEYSIAINPKNAAALLNKANGLYNLGNYKEALEYYKRYNELCPDDENGEMLIGFCNLLLEDFHGAIEHLAKAEKLLPPQSPSLIDVYKDWAFALCRLGRMDECMEVLDKTDKLDCDHNEMLVYRGSLLAGSGRKTEARELFFKALKNSGFSPNIFLKIAITVYESGDLALAYKIFKSLYEYYNGMTDGYAYFAACCYDLGRADEFLQCLKIASEHSPSELKALLEKLFPEGMEPKDYYKYMFDKIKRNGKM